MAITIYHKVTNNNNKITIINRNQPKDIKARFEDKKHTRRVVKDARR